MSKRYKRLMAAADAAGYVFAASDDAAPLNPALTSKHHLEDLEAKFRNGHHLAACKASEVASRAVAKLAPSRALATANTGSTTSWLNTALAHLRPKGLAA